MEKTNDNEVKDICEDILQLVENKTTKVKIDESIKNSYYVFLNDTIYLSTRQTSEDKKETRLVLICHECVHSVQSKPLHLTNFLIANLEMILFVIAIILKYIYKQESIVPIYGVIAVVSIVIRGILELDAILKSIKLAERYLKESAKEKTIELDLVKIRTQMLVASPLFAISLFGFKLLRLGIIMI